jgi:hypothetical protein
MSFSFNNAALADSASFATSLHADFFPGGKTPVKNTSASVSRPMVGQTLSARTLSDVINGDAFFRSPKYAVAAMNKSVSSSLNTLITGSGSIASAGNQENPNVKVINPESQGDDKATSTLTGGAAINRIIANSLSGKNFSGSFVSSSIANMQQMSVGNYGTETAGTTADPSTGEDIPSTENQSAGMRNVALFTQMTELEKGWYQERIDLLRSKYPNQFGDTSFKFDIPNEFATNGTTVYNGEDTYFPDAIVNISERIISNELILQTPTDINAYVAPALIELIILLHEKGVTITGGFDSGRQWTMVANDKQQLWLSDHSSGRAVDISSVGKINNDPVNLRGGVTREIYDGALYLLLDTLAEVPAYLLPDLLGIHQDYAINYGVNPEGNEDASTCALKLGRPWLEYVNFFADNRDNAHDNHIHLSFSGMRAGKYTGPGGQMTPVGIVPGDGQINGVPPGFILDPFDGSFIPDPTVAAPPTTFTTNYYGRWGDNIGQAAVYELLHTTVCSKEVAAILAAITARESGGGNPTSCNPNTIKGDYMSLGMFQTNMATNAQGRKIYELTDGNAKEQLQGWQIASKNWTTVFPGEQPPTIDDYNIRIDQKNKFYRAEAESMGMTGNARFNYVVEKLRELVDHRAWIPMNQAYMAYTMRTNSPPYYGFTKLGMTPETGYHFDKWGDGYKKPHGWLVGGVKFDDAVAVYENDGGTREYLKQWIKDVYAKDAACQLPIVAEYSAKYINDWLDGAVYE